MASSEEESRVDLGHDDRTTIKLVCLPFSACLLILQLLYLLITTLSVNLILIPQNTLYTHSLHQFYKSYCISGTVDFIFGNSVTVFRDYLIFILSCQLNPKHDESNIIIINGQIEPT
ncbi:hypothetical protein C4D60_Mb06t19880 [Musa balbisiana]|uniref:Pectinesterase n=1 Tax=Musa balbisiana TaxID=52838 RepID=A0A4V4H421_MUSBA|nr:hypothetical protein C4D60_Mb06t19880 [Musa balbisiana]